MSASADRRLNRLLGRIAEERANRARTAKKSSLSTAPRRERGEVSDLTGNGTPAEVAFAVVNAPIPEPAERTARYTFHIENAQGSFERGDRVTVPIKTRGKVRVTVLKGVDYTDIAGRNAGIGDDQDGLVEIRFDEARRNSKLKDKEKKDADKLFGGLKGSRSDGTITG